MQSISYKSKNIYKSYALYLLSRREYSQKKLIMKIRGKHPDISSKDLNNLIDYLLKNNYLSDLRYAEARVRYLIRRFYGERYILQTLRSEGVDTNIIKKAISNFCNEFVANNNFAYSWISQIEKYLVKHSFYNNKLELSNEKRDNIAHYKYIKKWNNKLYLRGFDIIDIQQALNIS